MKNVKNSYNIQPFHHHHPYENKPLISVITLFQNVEQAINFWQKKSILNAKIWWSCLYNSDSITWYNFSCVRNFDLVHNHKEPA
jgi:hypothetical protein